MNYKNKWVWITGASSGIGKQFAIDYANLGANLVLSARNMVALNELKVILQNQVKVIVQPLDLAKFDELPAIVNEMISVCGNIHLLINCGGISQRALAQNTDLSVDKRIMDINYLGTIHLSKLLIPHFIGQNGGQFAVITSLVGKFGSPLRTSYAASKHALHGFFDSLRAELFENNIKVTIICPGYIKTNISLNALTGSGEQQNKMDNAQANGMTVEVFSKKAIRAINSGKKEVYIGGKEVIMVYLKRYLPFLYHKIIRTVNVT